MLNESDLKPDILLTTCVTIILLSFIYFFTTHVSSNLALNRVQNTPKTTVLIEIPSDVYVQSNTPTNIADLILNNNGICNSQNITAQLEESMQDIPIPLPIIIKATCNDKFSLESFHDNLIVISPRIKIHTLGNLSTTIEKKSEIIHHIFLLLLLLISICIFHVNYYKKDIYKLRTLNLDSKYIYEQFYRSEKCGIVAQIIAGLALVIYNKIHFSLFIMETIFVMSLTMLVIVLYYLCINLYTLKSFHSHRLS